MTGSSRSRLLQRSRTHRNSICTPDATGALPATLMEPSHASRGDGVRSMEDIEPTAKTTGIEETVRGVGIKLSLVKRELRAQTHLRNIRARRHRLASSAPPQAAKRLKGLRNLTRTCRSQLLQRSRHAANVRPCTPPWLDIVTCDKEETTPSLQGHQWHNRVHLWAADSAVGG